MALWSILKDAIAKVIKENGNQEITGQVMQNVLLSIVSSVGENRALAGIATTSTSPGVQDGPIFYLTTTKGVYPDFDGVTVKSDLAALINTDYGWRVLEILNISEIEPAEDKIWTGNRDEYDEVSAKKPDVVYFITKK